MANYQDTQGNVIEVGNPDLNPQLTQGRTLTTAPVSSSINSTTLAPTTGISGQISTPTQTPSYNVQGITTTQPQPDATGMSDYQKQIQQQFNDIVGGNTLPAQEQTYRNTLNDQANIKYTTDAQGNRVQVSQGLTDLNNRLTQLKNQNLALQTYDATKDPRLAGLGITNFSPYSKENAEKIRQNTIESLGVSAQAEAMNNNFQTALHYIDAAVQEKYGVQEKELQAKKDNLQLILQSPAYTTDQKRQADAQIVKQQAALDQVAQNKENYKTAQTMGIAATSLYPNDPTVQEAVRQAGNLSSDDPQYMAKVTALLGKYQPQTGRYKDTITTTTNVDGSQSQTVRVFDSLTGQFVNTNKTSAELNAGGTGTSPTGNSPTTGKPLDFAQYGLLANTDYNPNNSLDKSARLYLDSYLKSGTEPSARSYAPGAKAGYVADVTKRAADLYFKATGSALPNPEIIKGYQTIINANNNFTNNLKIQEGTVKANFGLSLENLKNNDLNTSNINAVNSFLDNVKQFWLGNPEAAQYALQNATVTNEIGSLLAVRNATGTTVHDKLVSSGLIPKGASFEQQKAMLSTLLKEADNAKSSIATATGDLYKQIDPLLQDPNNPLRTQTQQGKTVQVSGKSYTVGQVYQDASKTNWVVDANGKWTKQ